jgi:hypothetical protein
MLAAFHRQRPKPQTEAPQIPEPIAHAVPGLRLSVGTWTIDKPEVCELPKPPVEVQAPKSDARANPRNLTPATLGQLLRAELDHFLKVEQDIGSVAEVETNLETAQHEHKLSQAIVLEDDSEELAELARLDAEIARLEMILQQKMEYSVLQ